MSEHQINEVLKRFKEEIKKTTDPETLLKLTAEYTKLRKQKRARKPTVASTTQPTDGARLTHHLVVQIEAKCKGRGGWLKLSRAEKDALLAEAKATLSAEERAAVEAFGASEVA